VREELGLEIEVVLSGLLVTTPHRYGDEGDWLISFGFEARAPTGEPKPADDVEAVHWVSLGELDNLEWAWPEHNKVLVERALAGVSRPGFPGARDSG
jgi:ADP-ribose pyrophosphatase YjhB (NUDIX family)